LLLAGTYNLGLLSIPTSGSPSSWIVYKSYGNGAVNFVWTAGASAQPMFKFGGGSFPSGPAYLDFRGFESGWPKQRLDGFFCQAIITYASSATASTTPAAPVSGAINCDYLTSDHNLINHNGLSLRLDQRHFLTTTINGSITYSGFHNIAPTHHHRGIRRFSNHTPTATGLSLISEETRLRR